MNDPLTRLEAELSGMRPAPLAPGLIDRIEAGFKASQGRVSPWPDRFLLGAMCSGALAACVILGVLLGNQPQADAPAGLAQQVAAVPTAPRLQDVPIAFARNDAFWQELLK